MARIVLILTAALSLTASVCIAAADDPPVLERFASYLESLRAQAGIPGLAAAITGPGYGVWTRGFGMANVERAERVNPNLTLFHLDGTTQVVTTVLVLRCAEGRVSLDDRLDRFRSDTQEPAATLRQVLTHTSGPPDNLVFSYRPERMDLLAPAVQFCTGETFRRAVADVLEQTAMADSVPGPDAGRLSASEGFDQSETDRYSRAMSRLATGYTVNGQGAATPASYSASTLAAWRGLITTVNDFAKFDLAVKGGSLLRGSIQLAWSAQPGRDGRALPHGLGWFVQSYNGQTVVWQFGSGNASSSMIVTVPARGLTLILLANSNGLARGFNLAAGDVQVSPFAKAFLGTFLR
jgi:CubicO group peptidase (beta-lactamase class C family)